MTKALTRCRSLRVVVPRSPKSLKQECEESLIELMQMRGRLTAEIGNVDLEIGSVAALLGRLEGRVSQ